MSRRTASRLGVGGANRSVLAVALVVVALLTASTATLAQRGLADASDAAGTAVGDPASTAVVDPASTAVGEPSTVPAAVVETASAWPSRPSPEPSAVAPVTPIPTPVTAETVPTPVQVAEAPSPVAVGPTAEPGARLLPFGEVDGVQLHHPAVGVAAIGFHQSNHEGARDVSVYDTAVNPLVLASRERLSGRQSAADVVVNPAEEIRSPVSGVVVRGGVYTLYCDQIDEFLVIAPDARPGWEVKVLHVVGLQVAVGDRVEGGVTPIASSARRLPFTSQVDEWSGQPSWPHTHLEVVDPSIPNQPNGGSGYEDCP